MDEDVTLNVGESKPGIGGERLPCQRMPAPHSSIPAGDSFDLPSWVAFDKQVLSFDGYFQESVTESRAEQYRVRHVKVYFYLEDDSIQLVEPRLKNSGLNQGSYIASFTFLVTSWIACLCACQPIYIARHDATPPPSSCVTSGVAK